jgi:hypothetical protein
MRDSARSLGLVTVFALALVPATARAVDTCFNVASSTLVLKAFALPPKGACKDARGFFLVSGQPWWLDGSACGSSDGTHVTLALAATLPDGGPFAAESLLVTVDRASGSGPMRQCVLDTGNGGGCTSGIAVHKIACSPSTIPVP